MLPRFEILESDRNQAFENRPDFVYRMDAIQDEDTSTRIDQVKKV